MFSWLLVEPTAQWLSVESIQRPVTRSRQEESRERPSRGQWISLTAPQQASASTFLQEMLESQDLIWRFYSLSGWAVLLPHWLISQFSVYSSKQSVLVNTTKVASVAGLDVRTGQTACISVYDVHNMYTLHCCWMEERRIILTQCHLIV